MCYSLLIKAMGNSRQFIPNSFIKFYIFKNGRRIMEKKGEQELTWERNIRQRSEGDR